MRVEIAEQVVDRRAALRVAACRDDTAWLVQCHDHTPGPLGATPVDGESDALGDDGHARIAHGPAIDTYAAGCDKRPAFGPRREAELRKRPLERHGHDR